MPGELGTEKNTSISSSSDTNGESIKVNYVTPHANREFLQENSVPDGALHRWVRDPGTEPNMLGEENLSTEQPETIQLARKGMTEAQQEVVDVQARKMLVPPDHQAEGAEDQEQCIRG